MGFLDELRRATVKVLRRYWRCGLRVLEARSVQRKFGFGVLRFRCWDLRGQDLGEEVVWGDELRISAFKFRGRCLSD